MELEKIHLVRILTMPGGTSEILMRGEKNGTVTSLFLVDNVEKI